jgi:hypothetical protein
VRDLNADDDEYDCLLELASRLAEGADVDEVANYLRMRIEDQSACD